MIEVGEIWKDIKGYEKKYQISNYGRVKSKARKTKVGINNVKEIKDIKTILTKESYMANCYKVGGEDE